MTMRIQNTGRNVIVEGLYKKNKKKNRFNGKRISESLKMAHQTLIAALI